MRRQTGTFSKKGMMVIMLISIVILGNTKFAARAAGTTTFKVTGNYMPQCLSISMSMNTPEKLSLRF